MRVKLKDICTKITDGSHFSPIDTKNGYPMLSIQDMLTNGFDYSKCKHISKSDYDSLVKNGCKPEKSDVLIAKDGSYLKEIFVVKEDKEEVILSSIAILRPNTQIVNPYFLKYYLSTESIKDEVARKYVSGSVLKRIILKNFENIEIDLPNRKIQDKIAEILSGIDEQINRNNEVVKKLQVLIQTIYSVTFEQYLNRTTAFNTELKREIPVGWTVKALKDFVTLTNGISYSEKDLTSGINMINLNSFNLDGSYKVDGIKKYGGKYKNENILKPYDLLISKTDVTRNRDIICKSILVPDYYDCDVVYSSDISKIEYKNISKYYLNLLFNSNSFHNYIKQFANGTVVLHLIVNGMLEFKVPVPNDNTFYEFDYKVEPLFKQMNILIKENIELSKLKEKLLPLLINNQLVI